jgi:hypothetical protein
MLILSNMVMKFTTNVSLVLTYLTLIYLTLGVIVA